MTLVRMTGIDKHFPGVHALKSAQFDLVPGEVHALMGENGAGKSTLMKVLSGIYQPDGGTVEVSGEPATINGPRAAQALGIGIIHQELALMNDLTVAQNIFIGREPRLSLGRLDETKLNADTAKIFAEMNISIDPKASIADMTVAMQQMVEIAKALSFRSRILIMDEPTAALGPQETAQVGELIKQLKKEGIGIFLISHDIHDVFDLADRVSVMKNGQVVGHARTEDVTKDEVLGMIILGKVTPKAIPGPGAMQTA